MDPDDNAAGIRHGGSGRGVDRPIKEKKETVSTAKIRFEGFTEGPSVQIMHVGPFAAEGPTIAKLHQYIENAGHTLRGKHHEIYLSDFRRVAPEKMKTVLRQPMKRHSGGNYE